MHDMKYFIGLLAFALFLVLLGFAIKNMGIVELHYYLGFVWAAPLSLMLLLSLMLGVLLGVIACIKPLTTMRKQLMTLRREIETLKKIV